MDYTKPRSRLDVRYCVRIRVAGLTVWADHDMWAPGPATARERAIEAFTTPLPETAYAGLSPDMAARVREREARSAELRQWPREVIVTRSRAAL